MLLSTKLSRVTFHRLSRSKTPDPLRSPLGGCVPRMRAAAQYRKSSEKFLPWQDQERILKWRILLQPRQRRHRTLTHGFCREEPWNSALSRK